MVPRWDPPTGMPGPGAEYESCARHGISRCGPPPPGCGRYDNLTVTIEHDFVGGGRFKTLAARGSPYMTFEFEGTIPTIRCGGGIREVIGPTRLTVTYLREG